MARSVRPSPDAPRTLDARLDALQQTQRAERMQMERVETQLQELQRLLQDEIVPLRKRLQDIDAAATRAAPAWVSWAALALAVVALGIALSGR